MDVVTVKDLLENFNDIDLKSMPDESLTDALMGICYDYEMAEVPYEGIPYSRVNEVRADLEAEDFLDWSLDHQARGVNEVRADLEAE